MIRYLILSVLVVLALTIDVDEEDLEKWYNECIAETGLSAEDVPKLKTSSFYEESQPARCMIKCMAVRAGYIDKFGRGNVEKLAADIKKYNLDVDKVNNCDRAFQDEPDLCMRVYQVHKCIEADKFVDEG